MSATGSFQTEGFEIKAGSAKATEEVNLEKGLETEEMILLSAKTAAGIGIGLVVVTLGATGIGAVIDAVIIPTVLAKMAGAVAGGGLGLSMGITDNRKEKLRRKRSVHFV